METSRLMFVFGTRPEAIKMAPLVREARLRRNFEVAVVVTAQHRRMLDDVLGAFEIRPDEDLDIMQPGQSLFHVTARAVSLMEPVLGRHRPDILIVQGDTTTTMVGALCGFYAGTAVAHVEAGLRSGHKRSPFPEEVNRKIVSVIADHHFAPTDAAADHLHREGIDPNTIHVTGNTGIDALMWMTRQVAGQPCPSAELAAIDTAYPRIVLVTGHRRESFGAPMDRIFNALHRLSRQNPRVGFVYPVHLNPQVQKPAAKHLGDLKNFFLLPPLSYPTFCWLMQRCHLVVTDSGGIQEEAPALGKPVLVTRRVTERPEAVDRGMAFLVGDDVEMIVSSVQRLLDDETFYAGMAKGLSPYGDGNASARILDVLSCSSISDATTWTRKIW